MTTGTENTPIANSLIGKGLAILALAFALSLAIGGGRAAIAPADAAAQTACPAPPAGLAPEGAAPTRFTMLIRINQRTT